MTIWICSIRLTPAWWSRGMICWSAPVPLSPSFIVFPPTPSPFPLSLSLSLFLPLLLLPLFRCISGLLLSLQMPIFLWDQLSFSLVPTPAPFLPLSLSLSLSFALCVRVCRWLLLAGSVTRGNWGRVHFNRTNGNKLIHFHCCFFFFFQRRRRVSGKRTEAASFKKRSKASVAGRP